MDSVKGPFSPEWEAKSGDSRHDESDVASAKKSGKKGSRVNSGPAGDYQRVASTRGSAKKASKAD